MEMWLWGIIFLLCACVTALSIKIYVMRKSAKEMEEKFAERIHSDTNTLIDLSSRDACMRRLASFMNVQLRELHRQRRRYEAGDRELKEAVTNISHDLRTPLTAICGYLDLLGEEDISETAKQYVQIMQNRTDVMRQLTEELFAYSIVTSTTPSLLYEKMSLNSALEESVSAYYAVLKHAKIQPEITIPEKKVIRRLDKKAVARILGNVLSNAVKYSDGDLKITLTEDGEIICINHASGLNEVEVGKLFHRFYTVEDARKSTGLGLSIAKTLTEEMGGRIYAEYQNGCVLIHIVFEDIHLSAYE